MSGSSKSSQPYMWLRKILRLWCIRNEHSPTWYYHEESVHTAPKQDASVLPAAYVTVTLPVSALPPRLSLPCTLLWYTFPTEMIFSTCGQTSEAKVLCNDWPWGAFTYRYKLVFFSLQKSFSPKANSYFKLRIHYLLYNQNSKTL